MKDIKASFKRILITTGVLVVFFYIMYLLHILIPFALVNILILGLILYFTSTKLARFSSEEYRGIFSLVATISFAFAILFVLGSIVVSVPFAIVGYLLLGIVATGLSTKKLVN